MGGVGVIWRDGDEGEERENERKRREEERRGKEREER